MAEGAGRGEGVGVEATLGKDAYQVSLRLSGYTPFMVSRLGDYPQALISHARLRLPFTPDHIKQTH